MKELLPVGSVVLLQGATKKTIIAGILQMKEDDPTQVYDYLGFPYPEGFMGQGSSYLFHHEDINDVVFRGYDNPERAGFLEFMETVYQGAQEAIAQQAEEPQP